MTFTFFDAADKVLFTRGDAETATWTVEELSLYLLFPFDPAKEVRRGMRVGFTDADGVFQPFEVRKAKTYEPDHYQELTCEHIAVAELTDEIYLDAKVTDETAESVLADVLEGTLWSVGTSTAENVSSMDISTATVWSIVRSIESNWNVYINPRVTVDSTGITGRYLDIIPANGTWRGIRLSVEKNADEVGVTIDDTETATAVYGFGKTVDVGSDEKKPLTFADVVWTATADHPAKPAGQEYLEDPDATAAYGRNGRPRFAFWTNSNISDAELLLEKTWESLKTTNSPAVTIECRVADLYRLGYADEPMRLHDIAIVDIAQTDTHLRQEIVRLSVDLLDPTETRLTIGTYIPNIVYIDRETNKKARGGGGGGRGKTPNEEKIQEFGTEIKYNSEQIELRAYQRDMTNVEEMLRQAGLKLDAHGVLIYADDNVNMLQSKLNVQADRISLVVTDDSNPKIKPAAIVASINQQSGSSTVRISANVIDIDGVVQRLESLNLTTQALTSGYIQSMGNIYAWGNITSVGGFYTGDALATWQDLEVVTSVSVSTDTTRWILYSSDGGTTIAGAYKFNYAITATGNRKTIHFLGKETTNS